MNGDGKRPLGFVNRHGHQTDFESVDLTDVAIDAEPTTTEPSNEMKKGDKRLAKLRRRRHLKWSRKKTLIVVAIAAILIIVPVVTGEILRVQYLASADSGKSALKAIVTNDVMPLQKKSDLTSKQLSGVTDKLEQARDGMCPGGFLDNLAMIYPRSKSAHETCINERGKIASLVTQLRAMEKILAHIESVNVALAPVTAPTTDAFAVIATQQSNWQSVSENIQKLTPPTELKLAHDQLVAAVKAVTDGWSKLNVANNEQNAANFQAAEKQLTDGYAAVRVSREAFTKVITDKQSAISPLATHL